jgi:hypothetical protein
MTVYYLNPLANNNVSENGEEGEDGREGRLPIDDQERDVVDFEAVCEISYACTTSVGVGNDNHLVTSIDEFLNTVSTGCKVGVCIPTLESWYM